MIFTISRIIGQVRLKVIGLRDSRCEVAREVQIQTTASSESKSVRVGYECTGAGKHSIEAVHSAQEELCEGNQPAAAAIAERVVRPEEIGNEAQAVECGVNLVPVFS